MPTSANADFRQALAFVFWSASSFISRLISARRICLSARFSSPQSNAASSCRSSNIRSDESLTVSPLPQARGLDARERVSSWRAGYG